MIIALGLYRSASTWTYNVLAAILGEGAFATFGDRADDLATVLDGRTNVSIVKCHNPDAAMRLLIAVGDLPVVLNVREPLDCVASLMTQFAMTFDEGLIAVDRSASCIFETLRCCDPIVLRYEDEDRGPTTVLRIARAIGAGLDVGRAGEIALANAPLQVTAFIARLAEQGVFEVKPASETWDKATHWHPNHVGSGKSGRYAEVLNAGQIARVIYATRAFRHYFRYANPLDQPVLTRGCCLMFSTGGEGLRYCQDGFGQPEGIGLWTEADRASLRLPMRSPADGTKITLHGHLGAALSCAGRGTMHVFVNGDRRISLNNEPNPSDNRITVAIDGSVATADLDLCFENLQSAAELGLSNDRRRLGFCLVAIEFS